MSLKRAEDVRRGDRISIDGFWLELIRKNPTGHPEGFLQLLFLNGRSILVRKDEELLVDD